MNDVSSLATAAYSRLARCEQYLLAMVIGPTSGEVCSSSRRPHSEAVEGEDTMRLSRHSVSIAAVLGLVGASAAAAPGAFGAKPPASTISVVQFAPNNTALSATEGQPGALSFVVNRA